MAEALVALACSMLARNARAARGIVGAAAGLPEGSLGEDPMALRLAADMLPLADQIKLVGYFAEAGAQRARGLVPDPPRRNPDSWAAADAQLAEGLRHAESASVDASSAPESIISFKMQGRDARCSLREILFEHLIPNQFFHLSMVYALLRQAGTPLGKIDYLTRNTMDKWTLA